MNLKLKNYIIAVISLVLLVVVDQVTKILAVFYLNPANGGKDVILIKDVFRLHYLENRGAAFGIFQNKQIMLIIVTLIIFLLICWFFVRLPLDARYNAIRWITLFIMAGAIGNFIDRIRLNFVIDFFYFELINFPVFNVADIYVTCSVILLIILFLFYYKEEDFDRIWTLKKKGSN